MEIGLRNTEAQTIWFGDLAMKRKNVKPQIAGETPLQN